MAEERSHVGCGRFSVVECWQVGRGDVHLEMTLSMPCHPSTVVCARGVLNALLTMSKTTAECREELAVIITEACTNAVVHSEPGSIVHVSFVVENRECVLEVGNRGNMDAPAFRNPHDVLSVGGRGLPVMAAIADSIAFAPAPPGFVRLRVTKHLPA